MSLVNDLIRRAREEPAELTIRFNQVNALAEHCHSCLNHAVLPPPPTLDAIKDHIRSGRVKFMDIPVRVLGTRADT